MDGCGSPVNTHVSGLGTKPKHKKKVHVELVEK